MRNQKDFKEKDYKYNCLIIKNTMDTQKDVYGKKLTDKDIFILKYEGPSFDNKMELHSFTRQINSVEKILRGTIDTLNKNNKIKDTSKDSKYYLELRRGSFETVILILFANPIVTNVVSDCIFEYLKYLLNKVKPKNYKNEVDILINNKNIRKSTKDIFNPFINDSDQVTIINGDITNNIIIGNKEREKIEEHLKEIESKLPIEEYEQELIGQIRRLDGVKAEGLEDLDKIKLGFVIEGQPDSIEINFEKEIKEEELRKLIFNRLRIKGKLTYRGGEIVKILVKSHEFSPKKKIIDYRG